MYVVTYRNLYTCLFIVSYHMRFYFVYFLHSYFRFCTKFEYAPISIENSLWHLKLASKLLKYIFVSDFLLDSLTFPILRLADVAFSWEFLQSAKCFQYRSDPRLYFIICLQILLFYSTTFWNVLYSHLFSTKAQKKSELLTPHSIYVFQPKISVSRPPISFQNWKGNKFNNTTNWYRSLFQTVDLFFLCLHRLKKAIFADFQVKEE